LAGQPLIDDPQSPGVKTKMLMQQSNFLVNQYINNTRGPICKMIRFIMKMYAQKKGTIESYIVKQDNVDGKSQYTTVTPEIIAQLADLVDYDLRPQKVDDNEQMRLAEMREDLTSLFADPMISQNPYSRRIIWRNYLARREYYTLEEIDKILTPVEQIQQELNSAAADQAQADQLGQQREQFVQGVQQQAEQNDASVTDLLKNMQG